MMKIKINGRMETAKIAMATKASGRIAVATEAWAAGGQMDTAVGEK